MEERQNKNSDHNVEEEREHWAIYSMREETESWLKEEWGAEGDGHSGRNKAKMGSADRV